MRISIDQPLCIHEQGRRPIQQDSVVPAYGRGQSVDRHFMVGEGPLADVYDQKASVTLHSGGVSYCLAGNCRIYHLRPGFDEPLFRTEPAPSQSEGMSMDNRFAHKETFGELTDIQPGDWIVLMTDGMCEMLHEEDLCSILFRPDWTAEHKLVALLDYTSENEDNHSAYLLHISVVEDDPVPAPAPVVEDATTEDETAASDEADEASDAAGSNEQPAHDPQPQQPAKPESKLRPVYIETQLAKEENFEESRGGFELTTRTLLLALLSICLLAMIAGFFIGLFK